MPHASPASPGFTLLLLCAGLSACAAQPSVPVASGDLPRFSCSPPGTTAEYRVNGADNGSPARHVVAVGTDPYDPHVCLSRTDAEAPLRQVYGFMPDEWKCDPLLPQVSQALAQFFVKGETEVRYPGLFHGGWLDEYTLKRTGYETIDVNGKPMQTVVVQRSFHGQSKFGEATFWLDPTTNVIVRYRAGNGWTNPVRQLDLVSLTPPRA